MISSGRQWRVAAGPRASKRVLRPTVSTCRLSLFGGVSRVARRAANGGGGDGDGGACSSDAGDGGARSSNSSSSSSSSSGAQAAEDPSRVVGALPRFVAFLRAGDPKEAWLSVSAPTLAVAGAAALLATALQGALWGGGPAPAPVAALEAAAVAGAVVAAASELWKILEGFQG